MGKRIPLKDGSTLNLVSSGQQQFQRRFTVTEMIGSGGFSLCYEAFHDGSGKGVLKEYYPEDAVSITRDARSHIVYPAGIEGEAKRFEDGKKKYLESHETLLKLKQCEYDAELSVSIPAFEIYHGADENGNIMGDTVYIWMPEPMLCSFDKICDGIRRHPTEDPEHKLVTVLSAIDHLTKSVGALHRAKLIHRDIKPSNFGFKSRSGEILTQTITIFDVDTIRSEHDIGGDGAKTLGFTEPEAEIFPHSKQTDIYSIGATLFYAINTSEKSEDGQYTYKPEYYDRMREIVDGSELIRASEANSHPMLKNIIVSILQKCLCGRAQRYASCEDLQKDIDDAIFYVLPSEIVNNSRTREKWVLEDIDRILDSKKNKNSGLVIQYSLYRNPLYRYAKANETTLNVLVIGFGNYGQKFLDACLQAGQMINKKLKVTVVSDADSDKDVYLSARPELSKFFDIDCSLDGSEEAYGSVEFETRRLSPKDAEENSNIIQDIICDHYDAKRPHYIFVALGNDKLNYAAAEVCATIAAEWLNVECNVCYVSEHGKGSAECSGMVFPVFVNENVEKLPLHAEIKRMAFNTHLVWEKDLNIDFAKIRRRFRKPYNYYSSVASVLSVKYKLYSIGIDLGRMSMDEAAKAFTERMTNIKDRKDNTRNELICIEHRRWVTEKLCLGWSKIDDLEECSGGATKDERRKKHVCIVRSKPNTRLADHFSAGDDRSKWDMADDSELDKLDELDRMSVELHRMYVEKARTVRRSNLLDGGALVQIKKLIAENRPAKSAFQEWYACIRRILNEDSKQIAFYNGFKDAFVKATKELPAEVKKSVRAQVDAFNALFYPIKASLEYRDWKKDDVKIIDGIPFILTYHENACMVIPFGTGDNNEVFENLAAPLVVNPARIIYIYKIKRREESDRLLKAIPGTVNLMNKKQLKAAVDFIIIHPQDMSYLLGESFREKLMKMGGGRIRLVKSIIFDNSNEITGALTEYLYSRSRGKAVFILEQNKTAFSEALQITGMYDLFPNYEFDSGKMEFKSCHGCEMLQYIRKSPFVSVTDLAAFRLSESNGGTRPEFFYDYKDLWDMYRKNTRAWKELCELLKAYSERHDVMASIDRPGKKNVKNTRATEHRYIMPLACISGVEIIVKHLIDSEVIEPESRVGEYTTDSCEVVIVDKLNNKDIFDRSFSQVYALADHTAISVNRTKDGFVNIIFDDLTVAAVKIPSGKITEYRPLMKFFKDKGFVLNLNIAEDGLMSFTYATRKIKELLTTAGKMLELHVYHNSIELGKFDDVVNSFEIDWEGKGIISEIDCVITMGLRTLLVECKARRDLTQEFYFKLDELRDVFGINATAVLVADTQERAESENAAVNAMQRERGRMLDVITVWKPEEINNIGHTLLRIINGTYVRTDK